MRAETDVARTTLSLSLSLSLLLEKEITFPKTVWPTQIRNPVIKSTACLEGGRNGGGHSSRSRVPVKMEKNYNQNQVFPLSNLVEKEQEGDSLPLS